MDDWSDDVFGDLIQYITISSDESDFHETFAGNLVNTTTDIRKINTEAEQLNFLFKQEDKEDLNCQSNGTPFAECVDTVSQTQAANSTSSASVLSEYNHSYYNPRKSQLRSRSSANSLNCLECGKRFRSISRKEKHISVRERCRNSKKYKQVISCLFCKMEFFWEEDKLNHLRTFINCQNFLKDHFFDCKFLDTARIYNNYDLTRNMCPFCLFSADNGDVFDHVLNAQKCRKRFEDAILHFNEEINTSSAHVSEQIQQQHKQKQQQHKHKQQQHKHKQQQHKHKQQQQQFSCNICSRRYASSWSLRAHKKKKHHEVTKSKKPNRQYGPNDLYCFTCRKFLKSQAEAEAHSCEPTRLLSRSWYNRAVWRKGEYECLSCRDKFFHARNVLEKHMYTHDEKKSPLFQFLPCSSKNDKIPSVHFLGVTVGSVATASKLHHVDIGVTNGSVATTSKLHHVDIGVTSGSVATTSKLHHVDIGVKTNNSTKLDLNVEKRRASENMLIEKQNLTCEKCTQIFDVSDVFIAHVLMNFPCLEHYQNSDNRPDNLCYCFKCKSKLEAGCKDHKCVGLVVQLFQCAVCPWISQSLTNLRNHEMIHHKRFLHLSKRKCKQVLSVTDGNVGETTDYHCSPCQTVFRNLSEFLKHISNPHQSQPLAPKETQAAE